MAASTRVALSARISETAAVVHIRGGGGWGGGFPASCWCPPMLHPGRSSKKDLSPKSRHLGAYRGVSRLVCPSNGWKKTRLAAAEGDSRVPSHSCFLVGNAACPRRDQCHLGWLTCCQWKAPAPGIVKGERAVVDHHSTRRMWLLPGVPSGQKRCRIPGLIVRVWTPSSGFQMACCTPTRAQSAGQMTLRIFMAL